MSEHTPSDQKTFSGKDVSFVSAIFLLLATVGFLAFQYLTYRLDEDLLVLDSLNSQRTLVERGVLYSQYEYIKAETLAAHANFIRESKLSKELENRILKEIMPALKRSSHMANKTKENSRSGMHEKIDTRCLRYYVEENCNENDVNVVSGTFLKAEKDINSYPMEYNHAKYLDLVLIRKTLLDEVPKGVNLIEQEISEKTNLILQHRKCINDIWRFSVATQLIGLLLGLRGMKES